MIGGLLLVAGAADGHDLVVSAREADWMLLLRADLELLGGLWLLSGRWGRAARIAAIALGSGLIALDLYRLARGQGPRPILGQIATGAGWVVAVDVLILTLAIGSRPGKPGNWRSVGIAVFAVGLGVAIDQTQVGQYPMIVTVRSGRTASGLVYLVYLPKGYYRSFRRWPMILALHGRGESGDDINLVRRQGLPRRVEESGGLPFVVVAPQISEWLWQIPALEVVLDEVAARFRIDRNRVYLTGNSMGGNGTWELTFRQPGRFAAIAPICGRGDPAWADRLREVPTWAFHGGADRIVPPSESERMIEAIRSAGGEARLTIYPSVGHDSWTRTYNDPAFYRWLLEHRRGAIRVPPSGRPSG